MFHQPSQYHHPKCRRRRSPTSRRSMVVLGFGLLAIDAATAQSVPSARWGQASTVAGTTLLVQGGKVDPDNSYSYTAAPNTNDLFALDLSQPFNCSDPPWAYLSGSQNPATSQGPAIAFHTLSAYSSKRALTFGGVGGPDMAIQTNADSVWTLEFWNQSSVTWTEQPENWGDEPTRRVYHSAAVYDKAVWITGGERADGSGLGFSETYLFTGSGSSGQFTNLQAAVAGGVLPDIVGHASVVLPNGLLVTIGGYSPSHQSMIPMNTIFTLDTTQDNAVWGLMVAEGSDIPSTRRNFALAVLPNNTLLIHGGSDASMQTFYSDAFTLNFGTNPPTWSPLLSAPFDAIGPRIDHMAAGVGKNVIFGFGRSPNGPAPAKLVVYDTVAGTTGDSYQPDSSGSTNPNSTPTATNGQPTVTGTPSTITDSASPSATVSVSVSTCVSTGTVTAVCIPTGTNAPEGAGSKKRAIIALSSVLGILGALAVALALIWWFFRRRNPKSPSASRRSYGRPWTGLLTGYRRRHLVGSGDTEDPVLPGATAREKIPTVGGARYSDPPRGIVALLAAPFRRSQEFSPQARKDMLGDEDDQELFVPIYGGGHSDETGSAVRPTFKRWGTSTKQLWNGMVNASTTSFKAAFGIGGTGTDGPPTPGISLFNRQPDSPDWWEKTNDLFSEDALLIASLPNGPTAMGMEMAATQRQRGGGSGHYQSATFSSTSTGPYRDPFVDPSLGDHSRESTAASLSAPYLQMARADSYQPFMMPLDDRPPRSSLAPGRPLSPPTIDVSNVRLAPGLITPGTLASSETLSHGHEFGLTTPGAGTDSSSGEQSTSPYPRSLLATPPTSIIGSAPTTPMKRSDSWWARFGRASLTSLSRSGSGAGGLNPIRSLRSQIGGGSRSPTDAYAALDFRDPNPPPRLEGIEETGQSNDPSPESVKPKEGFGDSGIGFVARRQLKHPLRDLHSKSQSSMATVDSEALEKMGGRMDVIQRGRTASSETTTPAGSIYEGWEYGTAHLVPLQHASPVSSMGDRPSPMTHKSSSGTSAFMPTPPSATGSGTQETYITAKTHQDSGPTVPRDGSDSFKSVPSPIPPPPPAPRRGRRPSSGLASRVAIFENMALSTSPPGSPGPLSPTSPRSPRSPSTVSPSPLREVDKRKSGGVRYGLMERPPLFVANPDTKSMRSGTESTVEGEPLTPPPPSASSPRPLL